MDQRLTEVTFGITINVQRLTEVTFKSNNAQLCLLGNGRTGNRTFRVAGWGGYNVHAWYQTIRVADSPGCG